MPRCKPLYVGCKVKTSVRCRAFGTVTGAVACTSVKVVCGFGLFEQDEKFYVRHDKPK